MRAPLTFPQHADEDCTGTWVFGFTDLGGSVSVRTHARCTRCGTLSPWLESDEDAEPYVREAMLHAHLLAGRV